MIDIPEFGVRDQRGDFDPLISESIFYKAQAVLSGKVPGCSVVETPTGLPVARIRAMVPTR